MMTLKLDEVKRRKFYVYERCERCRYGKNRVPGCGVMSGTLVCERAASHGRSCCEPEGTVSIWDEELIKCGELR